ncbi:hypothetical protein Tco_0887906, partial [Tanacetum coccineum]
RKAHFLEYKQIPSVGVFDEVSFNTLFRAFGKHLEEKHVTWAQFGKKRDKNATLQDFDQALVYRTWRRRQDFHLTPLMFQGDGVTNFCEASK